MCTAIHESESCTGSCNTQGNGGYTRNRGGNVEHQVGYKRTPTQRWRWPLATSPNAKIFAMWRKISDVFSHSGEDKNEMLPQYL